MKYLISIFTLLFFIPPVYADHIHTVNFKCKYSKSISIDSSNFKIVEVENPANEYFSLSYIGPSKIAGDLPNIGDFRFTPGECRSFLLIESPDEYSGYCTYKTDSNNYSYFLTINRNSGLFELEKSRNKDEFHFAVNYGSCELAQKKL